MKQFALAILLCISTFSIAQNTTDKRVISVFGVAVKTSQSVTYKTDVTLTLDNSYYGEDPYSSLDELLAKYFEKVAELNIDKSKFTEDELSYVSSGYRKDGTVLRFETNDKDEILKVASIRMLQVMPSYIQVKTETPESEMKKLMASALENAREKAEMLAALSGEEIDEIDSISSDYDTATYWQSPNTDSEYVRLSVNFTLK
ncbi:SIMPL domain-containing protein [Winogradskyella vidalii]|uniref:SIMPL domain-containing protein n=1 Tax=Winogradskyella vidalii TaxID=2615024 RepID=UPI0015CD7538|nr:SIMPL domain-containing protein [Winogradskyella vidalii]